jgi:hypothetical protein
LCFNLFLPSFVMRRQCTKDDIRRRRKAVLKCNTKFQVFREKSLGPTLVYD